MREYFHSIGNVKPNAARDAVTKLSALAQETRLSLFRLLVEAGPPGLPAGEIAERLAVAAPTLSFHLKELSHAELINATPRGRFVVYRADFDAMNALLGYLTEHCCEGGACEVGPQAGCTNC